MTGDLHLLFGLGRFTLALPLAAVQSVERPGRFTAAPFAVPWLLGVMAIRGTIVSVVDLARFAGEVPAGRAPGARLVVTQAAGLTAALLVDRVVQIVALPRALDEAPRKSGPLAECWRGAHSVHGEVVAVVDPARLMASPAFQTYQNT